MDMNEVHGIHQARRAQMQGRKKTRIDNTCMCVVLLPCNRDKPPPRYYVRRIWRLEVSGVASLISRTSIVSIGMCVRA